MKDPVQLFNEAEEFLRKNGFGGEIDWCDKRPPFDNVDDQCFLREYAWVVFNSGMRNSVIQAKWEALRQAFHFFIPSAMVKDPKKIYTNARKVFANERKINAVLEMAHYIVRHGFEATMRAKIQADPLGFLEQFSFIGKITKFHLARNLGFEYIKPDRHMERLAAKYEMTPAELCNLIHEKTGRRLGAIDVVLWRFMEQKGQTHIDSCTKVLKS